MQTIPKTMAGTIINALAEKTTALKNEITWLQTQGDTGTCHLEKALKQIERAEGMLQNADADSWNHHPTTIPATQMGTRSSAVQMGHHTDSAMPEMKAPGNH